MKTVLQIILFLNVIVNSLLAEETNNINKTRFDTNIWIVTPEFAKKYNIDPKYISTQLKGVEAVAFRLEIDNRGNCTWGGRCRYYFNGRLDFYVDESKYPLPWVYEYSTETEGMSSYEYGSDWYLATDNNFAYDNNLYEKIKKKAKLHWGNYPTPFYYKPSGNHLRIYEYISNGKWTVMGAIMYYRKNLIDSVAIFSTSSMGFSGGFKATDTDTLEIGFFEDKDDPIKFQTQLYPYIHIPKQFFLKANEIVDIAAKEEGAFYKEIYEEMQRKQSKPTIVDKIKNIIQGEQK